MFRLSLGLWAISSCLAAWTSVGPYGGVAHFVVVEPGDRNVVVAATRTGRVFRSATRGETWQAMKLPYRPGMAIHGVALDARERGLYFAGVEDRSGAMAGVWRTRDAGEHWEQLAPLRGKSVISIAVREQEPRLVAAGTRDGIYLSRDSGASWERISPPENTELTGVVSLAFDPSRPDVLYAGTTHLPWKTENSGKSWSIVHKGMIDDSDVFSIHVDRTRPDRVFASACSGIYSTLNRGEQWKKAQGIPGDNRRTYVITQDRQYPNLVYAGTTAGLWRSTDGGATWAKLNNLGIYSISLDPEDGRIIYMAAAGAGLLRSLDGGRSFRPWNEGFVNRPVTAFAVEPNGGKPAIYAATPYEGEFGGLFRSQDQGDSWRLWADQSKLLGENINGITLRGAELVATTYSGRLRSGDGGRNWQRAAAPSRRAEPALPKPPVPANESVFDVIRHPRNQNILFAATSLGLRRSRDGGESWEPLTRGLPSGWFRAVALNPLNPLECYAAAFTYVFRSSDGGDSWESFDSAGLEDVGIRSLVLDANLPGWLFAVTDDRGIFRRKVVP